MDSSSSSSSSSSSGSRQRRTLFFRGVIVCAAAAALRRTPKLIPHTRCPGCCCNRSTFYFVLHTIRDHPRLQRNCRRGDYLKPEEQLAIALSYLAQGGSFSLVVGRSRPGIINTQVLIPGTPYLVGGLWGCSVTSVHRCVNAVSHAIRARLSSFMALPSTDEEWQELVVGTHAN
ncbi:hypothetical protein QJQ45_017196 [Haematococcus lacustris]|nr:hypothetical protein QJQ45_017196 [Haematococcus lacustris]